MALTLVTMGYRMTGAGILYFASCLPQDNDVLSFPGVP